MNNGHSYTHTERERERINLQRFRCQCIYKLNIIDYWKKYLLNSGNGLLKLWYNCCSQKGNKKSLTPKGAYKLTQ